MNIALLKDNGKDLYRKWYEKHDIQTFRAIMRAIAERYTSRYEKENGIEAELGYKIKLK